MKKMYCVICGKYRQFEKPKTSYLQKSYHTTSSFYYFQ